MTRWKNRRMSSLALALGLTGMLALAACGGETTMGGGSEAASSAPAPAPASSDSGGGASSPEPAADFPTPNGGELNLYNWTDYISPELLERFESETGITVNLDNYDSNETMLAKLQAGQGRYRAAARTARDLADSFPTWRPGEVAALMRGLNLLR